MQLVIRSDGQIRCLYGEAIDLALLGQVSICRASHVEPDVDGNWLADLRLVEGPCLGPFAQRSRALAAEESWLVEHWLGRPPE
jgi:hypothetical protein